MKNSTKTALGVGAVLTAAAAAAAAGAYWLYGSKDAEKHRKMAKSWMLKARGEVMEAVEKLQNIDKKAYLGVVETVLQKYRGMSDVTSAEIAHMLKDFKNSWEHMQKAGSTAKKGVKSIKRGAKKVVRKAKQK